MGMTDEQRLNIIKLNNEDRLAGKLTGSRRTSDEDVKFLLDKIAILDTPLEYAIVPNDAFDDSSLEGWTHPREYAVWASLRATRVKLKFMSKEGRKSVTVYSRYSASRSWTPVVINV